MTKFLWSRRLLSCLLCCGSCPHIFQSHHQYQKQCNSKSKRDHQYHLHLRSGGGGGHIWRKTVVFGIFVFTLYFALLSFVSFLAVSNHRMVISAPTSSRSSNANHPNGHYSKVQLSFNLADEFFPYLYYRRPIGG